MNRKAVREEALIPEGWQKVALGEFMEFKNGINADKSAYGQGTKFVNIMDVFRKSFQKIDDITGLVRITDKQLSEYSVIHGDILFNRTSETREEIAYSTVYTDKETVTFGGFVIRGRQKKQLLLPAFAGYCFKNETTRKEMIRRSQGAVRANIGQKDLNKIPILIPPKDEQEKIAQILSRFDSAIEKTEALIAMKEKRFKWLLETLISDQRDNPEWQKMRLGEIGVIHSGGTPSTREPKNWNGDISWLTPSEVTKLSDKYINSTARKITRKGLPSTTLLPQNCLIVCTRATIGDCCINTIPMAINQGFKSIQPNEHYSVTFLYYIFQLLKAKLVRLSCGNTFGEVSKKDFANIQISVPSLLEQQAIAEALSSAQQETIILKQLAEQYRTQKRGLMLKLLTGKWRIR